MQTFLDWTTRNDIDATSTISDDKHAIIDDLNYKFVIKLDTEFSDSDLQKLWVSLAVEWGMNHLETHLTFLASDMWENKHLVAQLLTTHGFHVPSNPKITNTRDVTRLLL